MSLSVANRLTKNPLTRGRFSVWKKIANGVLGSRYELSVVLVGDTLMRRLNRTFRHKDKPTNVLAFPIAQEQGEIHLDIPYIHREAERYEHHPNVHLDYLFIHGLLHLAGYDHGDDMERHERRLMRKHITQRSA